MSDKDVILSCFRCFLGCLWPRSFGAESTDTRIAYTKGTYAEYTYTKGAYIRDAYIEGTFVRGACVGGTCIGTIGTIKYLRIYLQLFQNLEVRLLCIS